MDSDARDRLWSVALREIRPDLPEGWRWYRLACIGGTGKGGFNNSTHIELNGGVYPKIFTKGPRAGRPKFSEPAPGSGATVIVSNAEYDGICERVKAMKAASP